MKTYLTLQTMIPVTAAICMMLLLHSVVAEDTVKNSKLAASSGLQERVQQIIELSLKRPIIKFNSKLFKVTNKS